MCSRYTGELYTQAKPRFSQSGDLDFRADTALRNETLPACISKTFRFWDVKLHVDIFF